MPQLRKMILIFCKYCKHRRRAKFGHKGKIFCPVCHREAVPIKALEAHND